jgi:hypothetical protein
MIPDQSGIENNFNYNYLLVQTILKMRDARAERRIPEYWSYFEDAMQLVVSHLDFKLKGEIQQDYTILAAAINRIENSTVNPQTKVTLINDITKDFANAHKFYIMQALNRVGVVKVEDEGVIDFESVDLDTMTKIVRDTSGKSVINATEEVESKKTPPLIKPEMIMVYKDGKLMSMPKQDYMKLQADQQGDKEAPILMAEMPEEVPESDEQIDEGEGEEPDNTEEADEKPADDKQKQFGWKRKFE